MIPRGKAFAARVADILGLDETTVQDAIDQAKAEMQEEALQAKLDRLVENGHMTQEQADEYKTWIESKPEGLSPKMFGGFGKKHHRFGGRGWGGWGKSKPRRIPGTRRNPAACRGTRLLRAPTSAPPREPNGPDDKRAAPAALLSFYNTSNFLHNSQLQSAQGKAGFKPAPTI